MNAPDSEPPIKVAIFASGKAQREASRTPILNQVGTFLAKHKVNLIAMEGSGGLPLATLNAAKAAGAEIELIISEKTVVPKALNNATITIADDVQKQAQILREKSDVFVGLPGSLATARDLFEAALNKDEPLRTTILLNYENAYESMRGFLLDVLVQNHPAAEQKLQIADNIDDLWSKIQRIKR